MIKAVRKYYLISFYMITLIVSILLFMLHLALPWAGKYSVSFTQLAPALAVGCIALIGKDKTVIDDIKGRFHIDRVLVKWLIPAVVIPGVLVFVSNLVMTYCKTAFVSWKGDMLFFVLSFAAILVGSAAEEIGWRGFLLPHLQKRHSPFISSIIVGILWGVWHLNFTGGMLGFLLYTVTIIEMSILMTWVYNKTNGNIMLMTVWHLVFSLTSRIFLWDRFTLQLFIIQSIVFGIPCIFLLIKERDTYFTKKLHGYPPLPE